MRRISPRYAVVALALAVLVVGACGEDPDLDPVAAAQRRVSSAEGAVTDAQKSFDDAGNTFCGDSKSYIAAVDRYGKAFSDSEATVGDVRTAGDDLAAPQKKVETSAGTVVDAGDELAKAQQELAAAQVALVEAQSGTSTTAPTGSTTTTAPLVSTPTVDRVKQAQADLDKASAGITDETPLTEATTQFNSAAFALEVAWLQVFDEAGCFDDTQREQAVGAVQDYTSAVQTALHTAGLFNGEVDGVYGASTAAAVEQLQKANGLPETGYVDRATAAALDDAVQAKGGAVATAAVTHTAAVQSTLKLAGYWTGPVDGEWTPELTDALKAAQTDLGVPATGEVDTATLAALEAAIAEIQSTSSTTTTSSTTPASTTTTSEP